MVTRRGLFMSQLIKPNYRLLKDKRKTNEKNGQYIVFKNYIEADKTSTQEGKICDYNI